jgi:hypothetical protein
LFCSAVMIAWRTSMLLQAAADDQPFPLYGRERVAWKAP